MAHDSTNVKKYSNFILHCHLVLVQCLVQGQNAAIEGSGRVCRAWVRCSVQCQEQVAWLECNTSGALMSGRAPPLVGVAELGMLQDLRGSVVSGSMCMQVTRTSKALRSIMLDRCLLLSASTYVDLCESCPSWKTSNAVRAYAQIG